MLLTLPAIDLPNNLQREVPIVSILMLLLKVVRITCGGSSLYQKTGYGVRHGVSKLSVPC
jgi:hypothetical protein